MEDESAEMVQESETKTKKLTRRKQAWDDVNVVGLVRRKSRGARIVEAEVFGVKAL